MISYKPFFDTLKKKNISTYTLIYKYGISSATIDRIKKGGGITTAKLNDLCNILNCNVEDIIVFKKES
ncbi:MAG: helix-turn-helix transcriptional regulator [Clostridia bacterium]|jgi:DNA-binding Xre family transcriptional regulator|nr:helix-turn-helix transcriptional regulator [Clostridia bacterium]